MRDNKKKRTEQREKKKREGEEREKGQRTEIFFVVP